MKTHTEKQNEISLIQKHIQNLLIKTNQESKIDSFGNVVYEIENKKYRFKIKTNVIRHEAQIIIEATQYSKQSKEWIRLKSYSYKNILEKAKKGIDKNN